LGKLLDMATIRTFIAVNPAQRVNNNVSKVVGRLATLCDQYRWVEPENLHVMLNYVGDVVDIEIPELCKLIKNVVEPMGSFDMSLQGVSGFSSAEEPRTLWIGVDEGAEALRRLYKALEDVLHHWGVNKDRNEYVPHMTLGRVTRGGRWNEELLTLVHKLRNHDGGFWHVGEIVVYSSFQDRGGPTYTPMARVQLKG
jgi:2'-5' RNA ligase